MNWRAIVCSLISTNREAIGIGEVSFSTISTSAPRKTNHQASSDASPSGSSAGMKTGSIPIPAHHEVGDLDGHCTFWRACEGALEFELQRALHKIMPG